MNEQHPLVADPQDAHQVKPPAPPRSIIVDEQGKISVIGKWRVGELLAVAEQLAALVRGIEVG